MPQVTSYTPGSFCWVELMTSDASSAKSFYTQLFNWGVNDLPMGEGAFYHMLQLHGKDVGALYQRNKEQQTQRRERAEKIIPHAQTDGA